MSSNECGIGNGVAYGVDASLEENGGDNAIKAISDLACAAMRPGWMKFPGGDKRQVFVSPEGEAGAVWVPARQYTAYSIRGFLEQVRDLAGVPGEDWIGDEKGELSNDVRVFVGNHRVVAVFNERTNRCDTVMLELRVLDSAMNLLNPKKMAGLSQKELEWMLRSDFADRVSPSTFLPAIRKLKIRDGNNAGSDIAHGRETVDLSIEAEIAGVDGGIAENVTLSTSVFEELAECKEPPVFSVNCAVRIDIANRAFTLRPLEGEVSRAMAAAREEVVRQLREVELPDNVLVFADSAF